MKKAETEYGISTESTVCYTEHITDNEKTKAITTALLIMSK